MKPLLLTTCLLLGAVLSLPAQTTVTSLPSADEVMSNMFVRDNQRETLAAGFNGTREYLFDNQHYNKHAEMLVSVTINPEGTKQFQVVSEQGWKSAHKHVLHKMLASEAESSEPATRPKTRLIADNYDFEMVQLDILEGRPTYVIDAVPKRHDKYLFRGRIWVDAEDYALARVEGEPAKSLSFWIRSVHFVQQYRKSGLFWVPVTTTSVTQARIFGTTEVTIRYLDYAPLSAKARGSASATIKEAHYVGN